MYNRPPHPTTIDYNPRQGLLPVPVGPATTGGPSSGGIDLRHTVKWWVVLACMGFALVTVNVGCAASRTRPGVSESRGTYEWYAPADIATTWDAASDAMRELQYTVTSRSRPEGDAWHLEARDAGSNRIFIGLEPGTLEATRVTVRIEPGHNDSMSQLVLEAIRRHLGGNK